MKQEKNRTGSYIYFAKASEGIDNKEMGEIICIACNKAVKFQNIRWNETINSYTCINCFKVNENQNPQNVA